MFNSIKIKNFRGIKDLTIKPLNKINIFVGDNMVGKTTILESIFIATNPNNPDLPFRTNRFRNIIVLETPQISSFFYNFETNNKVLIEMKSINYERKVEIIPKYTDFKITNGKKNEKTVSEFDAEVQSSTSLETNLVGLELNFNINEIKRKSSIAIFPSETQLHSDKDFLNNINGRFINTATLINANLASLFSIAVEKKKKSRIIEFLKFFKKTIADINLVKNNMILVEDEDFKERAVDINLYGSGFVRSLYIFLSFLNEGDDILLIDEIENGIHYSRQKILWKAIKLILENDNKKQLFISTHSSEMLKSLYDIAKEDNFLKMISLFRIEKINNISQSVYYSTKQFLNAIELNLETR
jgi:AAA15 family ATPase/GTPase